MSLNKPKIFISGPMSGISHFNCKKFNKYEEILSENFIVINPIKISRKYIKTFNEYNVIYKDGYSLTTVIQDEIEALKTCDYIFLLKGWKDSPGSLYELYVAIENKLKILLEE